MYTIVYCCFTLFNTIKYYIKFRNLYISESEFFDYNIKSQIYIFFGVGVIKYLMRTLTYKVITNSSVVGT